MTTESSQPKQPQKPLNSSPTDISERVDDSYEGCEIIKKTVNPSTKDVDMTEKVKADASVLEKNSSSSTKTIKVTKKDKVNASVWQSQFLNNSCQVGKFIRTSFPAVAQFYDEKVKRYVDS